MRKPRSTLLVCVLVMFGVSLLVPVRDLPETAYDESEAPPYLSTSMASLPTLKLLREPGRRFTAARLRSSSFRRRGARTAELQANTSARFSPSSTILNCSFRC